MAWLGSWLKTMSCKADLLKLPAKTNCLAVPSKSKVFLLSPFLQSETAPSKVVLQHSLLLGSTGLVLLEEAAPLHPLSFVSPAGIMANHCHGRGRQVPAFRPFAGWEILSWRAELPSPRYFCVGSWVPAWMLSAPEYFSLPYLYLFLLFSEAVRGIRALTVPKVHLLKRGALDGNAMK